MADPEFGLIQILQWWILNLDSYRFYSGGSRIWTHIDSTVADPEFGPHTDSTVADPGFGTHADSTVADTGFRLIQILQWWILNLESYRFYSGGSRIWTHADSTVVDPEFGIIQILQ